MRAEPRNVLILGMNWSGKSYAAGYSAATISRDFVIIVSQSRDPAYLHHLQVSRIRFVRATSAGYSITPELLEETRQDASLQHKRYLYITVGDLTPNQVKDFETQLVQAVKASRNLALIIDEAHLFCDRIHASDELRGFARGARHYGVDLVFVTHRLFDIDVSIRCVLTHLVLFRTVEGRDLDVLARHLDLGARAAAVAQLPRYYYLFINRAYPDAGQVTASRL